MSTDQPRSPDRGTRASGSAVATIRMSPELYERLKAVAEWASKSMNGFAVAVLTRAVEELEGSDELPAWLKDDGEAGKNANDPAA
jgi:hypothetical protein